ncbi:unnamed protein product, partial [Fusarium fujikuroi]
GGLPDSGYLTSLSSGAINNDKEVIDLKCVHIPEAAKPSSSSWSRSCFCANRPVPLLSAAYQPHEPATAWPSSPNYWIRHACSSTEITTKEAKNSWMPAHAISPGYTHSPSLTYSDLLTRATQGSRWKSPIRVGAAEVQLPEYKPSVPVDEEVRSREASGLPQRQGLIDFECPIASADIEAADSNMSCSTLARVPAGCCKSPHGLLYAVDEAQEVWMQIDQLSQHQAFLGGNRQAPLEPTSNLPAD